uniref:Uncharacterized protein n=1 Tax=Rhizophora mucronata TaxID=61149 RepID=A0A2P2JFJ4_RHIMU
MQCNNLRTRNHKRKKPKKNQQRQKETHRKIHYSLSCFVLKTLNKTGQKIKNNTTRHHWENDKANKHHQTTE